MLQQFTFENFKSFKDEVTLDLIASPISEHKSDIAVDVYDEKVLKVISIFGANASGKSNIIKAFNYMKRFVLLSFSQDNFLENNLFKVDKFRFENENRPSSFEVLFSLNQDVYQYGFSMNHEKILEEYLYIRKSTTRKEQFNTLFYLQNGEIQELDENIGEATELVKLMDQRTLFLSLASKLKIPVIRTVFDWFKNSVVINYGDESYRERVLFVGRQSSPLVSIIKDKERKTELTRFVKAIDLGIENFGLIENPMLNELDSAKDIQYQVVTYHKNIDDGKLVPVPLSSESSGTRKMISLFIQINEAIKKGDTVFVDELDAKLHPLLLRYIIILFHDINKNPNNAQLIFTTHDVFTLDKDNFRRDEIWFVDKDKNGVSDLYSLDSYVFEDEEGATKKIRKDASYGRDYILGKYKSIPKLKR
ncbi:AAA family ATPase [Desemzia sp. FAM 23991]|uniref:AAA family ATPase n=1 Tax=unclassified Desemzia TaxID=2685243 RepID=UPI00388B66CD